MFIIPTIKILGDTTHLDQKILDARTSARSVKNEVSTTKQEILSIAQQGRQVASMFMSNLKQTTALQTLTTIQSNIMMGVQIKNVLLQANAALVEAAGGNPFAYARYAAFNTIALSMGYNLGRSQLLLMQQQQLQDRTEQINAMRDIYS